MSRLHPAPSRVRALAAEVPARFMAFDVLARDGRDLRPWEFVARRAQLLDVLDPRSGVVGATPSTRDRELATRWLGQQHDRTMDGVVAKADDLRYRTGARAMLKVKR